jgi:4-hydroxy-2-oxoheptanedioate aldolase
LESLPKLVQSVALAGAVPIVRVPANEIWLIGRALDAGAYGVMVPLVNTAEQAARAVAACRYMPGGGRSVGAYRPAPLIASSPQQADKEIICIVQIESKEALDNLEEICKVPGVDVVYIGPGDLALSLGLKSKTEIDATVFESVRNTALKNGVMPAMHGESGSEALWAIENGFRVTTAGADIDYLHIEAREALAIAKRVSPDDVKNKSWLARVPRIAVGPPSQVHE